MAHLVISFYSGVIFIYISKLDSRQGVFSCTDKLSAACSPDVVKSGLDMSMNVKVSHVIHLEWLSIIYRKTWLFPEHNLLHSHKLSWKLGLCFKLMNSRLSILNCDIIQTHWFCVIIICVFYEHVSDSTTWFNNNDVTHVWEYIANPRSTTTCIDSNLGSTIWQQRFTFM